MGLTNQYKPDCISAEFKIITPMFIGDAEQQASEIRAASIKGALRFWWRCLNWGRFQLKFDNNADALAALHQQEADLFGSGVGLDAHQSRVILRVLDNQDKHDKQYERGRDLVSGWKNKKYAGLRYLAGQGLAQDQKQNQKPSRKAIPAGGFTLQCLIRPCVTNNSKAVDDQAGKQKALSNTEVKQQLCDALLALGTLGGLGARARKGFGSIAIQALLDNTKKIAVPNTIEDLRDLFERWQSAAHESVQQAEKKSTSRHVPFTAISDKTVIESILVHKNAIDLLNELGITLHEYRSNSDMTAYGSAHSGKQLQSDQASFKSDRDLMIKVANGKYGRSIEKIPARTVFGLPHNYFFSNLRINIEFNVNSNINGNKINRRASPLFIHLHQFPGDSDLDKQTALVLAFFPALFLYEGVDLEFVVKRNNRVDKGKSKSGKFKSTMLDWIPISDFIDRVKRKYSDLNNNKQG